MDKGMPQLQAEQMQLLEVSALLRQKEKQQRANRQPHSLYQFCIWGRDPARALDKRKKTSGCGSMWMEKLKDILKQVS